MSGKRVMVRVLTSATQSSVPAAACPATRRVRGANGRWREGGAAARSSVREVRRGSGAAGRGGVRRAARAVRCVACAKRVR